MIWKMQLHSQSLLPIRAMSHALALRPRIGTPICGWRALPFVQLPPICEQELTPRGHRSRGRIDGGQCAGDATMIGIQRMVAVATEFRT